MVCALYGWIQGTSMSAPHASGELSLWRDCGGRQTRLSCVTRKGLVPESRAGGFPTPPPTIARRPRPFFRLVSELDIRRVTSELEAREASLTLLGDVGRADPEIRNPRRFDP
jgi:hypothetical protein